MENSTLILNYTGRYAGFKSTDSKIFIKEKAGQYAGSYSKRLFMIVNETSSCLADHSVSAKIFANTTKGYAGDSMENGELNVNVVLGDPWKKRLDKAHSKKDVLRL